MKLNYDMIKNITVGAASVTERDGGVAFSKCTDGLLDAWRGRSEALGKNAAAATGVRLDFHTSSQSIAFGSATAGKYEIKIDGLSRARFSLKEGECAELELCAPLGEKQESYRVTLVLPSHGAGAVLDFVELDDGAWIEPHKFDRKFLFIGDSITQGWESSFDSFSYAYRVSEFFNAESVIQGVGGAYFHEDCFDGGDFDPDVVFVSYGTNDFGHYKTLADLGLHTDSFMERLAEAYGDKKVFVISPIWRKNREGKAMGSFADCRRVIVETAAKYGFEHIDGLTLVPPMEEMLSDGLHPNDIGFSFYSENLIRSVISKL